MTISPSSTPLLRVSNVSKTFGAQVALDNVSLDVRAGEVVGLIGPNGAGKSTLIKILDGVYVPDTGTLSLDGKPVKTLRSCPDVGFIHQDLALIDSLTISENLRLGQRPVRAFGPILSRRRERALAKEALRKVGLGADPDTQVGDLSPGQKSLVAVARALARGARLLVVDEATSTLTARDASLLIDTLRKVAGDGGAVIIVSHKLTEILGATDRVVLLLDGRIVKDQSRAGLDREGLFEMLLEHEAQFVRDEGAGESDGEVVLRMQGVRDAHCGPVDLELRSGEVLGLSGSPGSGLHDIAYLAAGAAKHASGQVSVANDVRRALVPPHRETQGGFHDLSVRANMTISAQKIWRGPLGLSGLSI